jgi:hypothetical protein
MLKFLFQIWKYELNEEDNAQIMLIWESLFWSAAVLFAFPVQQ